MKINFVNFLLAIIAVFIGVLMALAVAAYYFKSQLQTSAGSVGGAIGTLATLLGGGG